MSETDSTAAAAPSPGRRTLLDWLLGLSAVGSVLAIVYPIFAFTFPRARAKGRAQGAVLAARSSELPLGSGKVFPLGSKPAILVHTPDDKWRAFGAKCSHLSCTVSYRNDMNMLWCPCHDGRFDLTGKNLSGPPPRPLATLGVVVKGDEIYVTEEAGVE